MGNVHPIVCLWKNPIQKCYYFQIISTGTHCQCLCVGQGIKQTKLHLWYPLFQIQCGKHLHDHIISLRGEIWAHKCSLTPSYFIEVHVPSQESERSCISELRVSGFPLFPLFLFEFGTAPTVWWIFVSHFIDVDITVTKLFIVRWKDINSLAKRGIKGPF
jgi:hypothetical protein